MSFLNRLAMFEGSSAFVRKFNLPTFPDKVSGDIVTQREIKSLRRKGIVTIGSEAILRVGQSVQ